MMRSARYTEQIFRPRNLLNYTQWETKSFDYEEMINEAIHNILIIPINNEMDNKFNDLI